MDKATDEHNTEDLYMRTFLALILPFIILLIPIGLLTFVSIKWRMNRLAFGLIAFGCFALGLVVPIVSTFVSANGLSYGYTGTKPLCVTGAAFFFMLGHVINLIGIPIASIILFPRKIVVGKI